MTAGRYRAFVETQLACVDLSTQEAKDYGILGRMKLAMLTKPGVTTVYDSIGESTASSPCPA